MGDRRTEEQPEGDGGHDADDAQDIGIGGGVDRHLGRGEHAQASGDEEPEGRKEDDQTCEAGDDRLHGIRTEDGDEGAEEGAAQAFKSRIGGLRPKKFKKPILPPGLTPALIYAADTLFFLLRRTLSRNRETFCIEKWSKF